MCVPCTKIYYVIRSGVGSGVRSWRTRFNGQQLRLSWITHGFVYMRENVRPEQLANHKSPEKNYSEIEYFIILFCGSFWFLLSGFPSYLLIPKGQTTQATPFIYLFLRYDTLTAQCLHESIRKSLRSSALLTRFTKPPPSSPTVLFACQPEEST